MVIGDDSQRSFYRPYLMRWTGAGWRLARYGPMVTAARACCTTLGTGPADRGQFPLPSTPAPRSHYRFGAEIWWLADAQHSAGYTYGASTTATSTAGRKRPPAYRWATARWSSPVVADSAPRSHPCPRCPTRSAPANRAAVKVGVLESARVHSHER
jgi:hypothetical protein